MQQTDFDYEVLVGEDDSSDGTREICKEYAAKYPNRIRLFLNDRKNVIYISGRPTGRWNFINLLKNAKGKYIALCEGDDYWTDPYKLQKQVDFLESHPDCAICFHAFQKSFESVNREPETCFPPGRKEIYTLDDFLRCSFIGTLTAVYRRGLFGDFPEWYFKMPQGDWALHVLNAQHGDIGYIDEVMAVYRIHGGGAWSSMDLMSIFKKSIKSYQMINPYLAKRHQEINMSTCLLSCYELANLYTERGDKKNARLYFKKCLTMWQHSKNGRFNLLILFFRLYLPRLWKLMVRLKHYLDYKDSKNCALP